MKLLNIDSNPKTVKGQKKGYKTAILYLAPGNHSGYEVCPHRSKQCFATCLYTAGRGNMDTVKNARITKTRLLMENQDEFMARLITELVSFNKKTKNDMFKPCVRLNGMSDINWRDIKVKDKNIFELFPSIQFYDYTKDYLLMKEYLLNLLPRNYHLTFSMSEDNISEANWVLQQNGNVSTVFNGFLPTTFFSAKVIDGDEHDLRFLDPKGVVVGLLAKGKARKLNTGGFVQDGSSL